MRPYARVFLNTVMGSLSYRWDLAMGLLLQGFALLVTLFIWSAVFRGHRTVGGFTRHELISYLVVAALVQVVFSPNQIFWLARHIKDGRLSQFLTRPYRFGGDGLATFLGTVAVQASVVLPLLVALDAIGVVSIHPSVADCLQVGVNVGLLFTLVWTLGSLGFWLLEMWPLKPLYNACVILAGGTLFPLCLYPAAIFHLLQYTPFGLLDYVNVLALEGQLASQVGPTDLAASLGWIVGLGAVQRLLWVRGLRRYEATNL